MDDASFSRANVSHATRLTKTIRELQTRVEEQEAALEKLRSEATSTPPLSPSSDNAVQVHQLQTFTKAYATLTPEEPHFPEKYSTIPSLLALRIEHRTIEESRECLTSAESILFATQELLSKEVQDLRDANLMTIAMSTRIDRLQEEIDRKTQRSNDEIGREMVREAENKRRQYQKRMKEIAKGLDHFIEEHLAPLLLVEGLGGPIVGDMMDVDELTLEAGFNSQGKVKKRKEGDVDRRQRRIDDIWNAGEDDGKRIDRKLAAKEMRDLTNRMMDALLQNHDSGYVEIERESAASRFLVRSKVALLHPRDARKLRMVDFGRDLDD